MEPGDPRKSGDRFFGGYSSASKGVQIPVEGSSSYQCFTRIEQAPNPASRVTLDTEKDGLGVPRASLHWELTDFEKEAFVKYMN